MPERAKTSDALEIIDRMVGDDLELRAMIDEERAGAEIRLVADREQVERAGRGFPAAPQRSQP